MRKNERPFYMIETDQIILRARCFFFATHVFRKKFVNRSKAVKLSGTAGVNVKSSTGRSTRKSAKCCAKIRKKRAACIIPLPFFLQISVFSTQYFFK